MSTADAPGGASPGGASTAGEEEMEDDKEMEDDSTSNVPMLAAGGTFIAGTADGTVTEARQSSKRHRAAENMSEDLLNRRIQDYGLISPERAKILCGTSSRNTEPSTSIVQMTILTCRSKPSARSAWRTRTDVSIAQ